MHLSRTARVVSAHTGLTVTVQVAQECPACRPLVVLTLWCPDGYAFPLDTEHARAVGWMLVSMGRNHLEGATRLGG
jgi:hypothetical protein